MIGWVHERFRAWGVWIQMERRRGSAGLVAAYAERQIDSEPALRAYVPLDELQCDEVDDFVLQLADPWRRVVTEFYCCETTADEHARRLGMSSRTLYARLDEAQGRFVRWLDERKARAV